MKRTIFPPPPPLPSYPTHPMVRKYLPFKLAANNETVLELNKVVFSSETATTESIARLKRVMGPVTNFNTEEEEA